jgi:acyl-homoserine lactone synthase
MTQESLDMILLINRSNRAAFADLLEKMFKVRYDVYIKERGWKDLDKGTGEEHDQFDTQDAVYVVAVEDGEVVGGSRYLDTRGPHLISEVFADAYPEGPPRGDNIVEVSRFFVRADMRAEKGPTRVASELLCAGAEMLRICGASRTSAFAEPAQIMILLQMGTVVVPLAPPKRYETHVSIPVLLESRPISLELMRKARGVSGPLLHYAASPDETPRLYADVLGFDPARRDLVVPRGAGFDFMQMSLPALADAYSSQLMMADV